MTFTALLFGFFLGAIVGSFLNVVLFRFDTKESVRGRSHCRACGAKLSVRDLLPLLSYLLLRGRCRFCGAPFSFQYPFVEFSTGLLFAGIIYTLGPSFSVYLSTAALWYMTLFSFFVLITVYDIHHKIIPNEFVYPLVALSAAGLFFDFEKLSFILPSVSQMFSGPLFALPFAALWFISKGRWMGLGDAKLSLALGWIFGFSASVIIFLLSFWIGALVSLSVLFVLRRNLFGTHKALTMKSEVPFAPFLIIGALLVFFFDLDIALLMRLLL